MKITSANDHRATGPDTRAIAVVHSNPTHRQIATIAFLFVALFLMIFGAGRSFGQANGKYDVKALHPKLTEKVIKQLDSARKGMAGRRNVDTDSREWKMFRAYYTAYIFNQMTLPDARGELSGIVNQILKDLNRAQRSNATAAPAILQWSIKGATDVASGNYHPAARINATILLGHLDEKPADNRAGTPPTPSSGTLKPLRELWENQDNPDGVRAAALQGIRRWVAHGFNRLNADDKKAIQDSMFQLAESEPAADRDRAAHGFLQRYAVDILYVLNDGNSSQKLTDTLIMLSSNPATDPVISLYAAQKLAHLGDEIKPIANPEGIAKAWSTKAAVFFGQQSARLAEMERPKPVPDQPRIIDPEEERERSMAMGGGEAGYGQDNFEMGPGGTEMDGMGGGGAEGFPMGAEMGGGVDGGMMMPGGMGRAATNPQPIEVIAIRRKLNHALQSLNYGLTGSMSMQPAKNAAGVVQASAEADRAPLQQLVDAIAVAVENINDPQYDTREKFAEMVVEEASALEKLARRLGGKPADADPAPGTAPDTDADESPRPDVALTKPARE